MSKIRNTDINLILISFVRYKKILLSCMHLADVYGMFRHTILTQTASILLHFMTSRNGMSSQDRLESFNDISCCHHLAPFEDGDVDISAYW